LLTKSANSKRKLLTEIEVKGETSNLSDNYKNLECIKQELEQHIGAQEVEIK